MYMSIDGQVQKQTLSATFIFLQQGTKVVGVTPI